MFLGLLLKLSYIRLDISGNYSLKIRSIPENTVVTGDGTYGSN